MLKLLTAVTYVCLACVSVLTLWHVVSGQEPSAALLTLIGTLIGAVIAKAATESLKEAARPESSTLKKVED